jgi:hypothetical protein
MKTRLQPSLSIVGTAVLVASSFAWVAAQRAATAVAIDADDIGGVVTSAKGPEAGVWVIAETKELPTKFARIVVTDDRGRYVLPDLPRASYQVFVRGYGLLDSARQTATPGQQLHLTATAAPDPGAAAEVYPAAWWLSMIPLPDDKEAQRKFSMDMKECYDCHQIGGKATREMPPAMSAGASSSLEAWERRTKVGPSGPAMGTSFMNVGDHRKAFADWTDRVARGEAPGSAPPRPAGVERNIVITEWDWGTPTDGRSDNAASDTRNARVNANGPIYGASEMTDALTILDPIEHTSTVVRIASGAPDMVSSFNASPTPSPAWGSDVWKRSADPRSIAIDGQARVWLAVRSREAQRQPPFCGEGSGNTFARYYPLRQSGRQVALYDQKTRQFSFVNTCFSADHNMISPDNKIYFGQTGAIGWVDITAWDKTHDAEASQGWCPAVLDTNSDGRISEWTEPNVPVDPAKDHRINFGCYSIAVSPADGSLWCSGIGRGDRRLLRMEKGSNPPQSCRSEFYEPPPGGPIEVNGSGGLEVDSEGVVWQNWRASGHFSAFDRRKCRSTRDPGATGQSCPEGYTFYRKNDPTYTNSVYHANESYLTHMDVHDVLGLGKDAPMYGSVNTDAIEVLNPKTKQFVTLRVPYPMGFFPRSANGRIDNPSTGWKGKGLWADYASYAGWHIEGGPGTLPKVVKFQVRPNPIAK